ASRRARRLLLQGRLPADEASGLVEADEHPEAGLESVVGVVDVVAVVAVAFLQAQAGQSLEAGMAEAERLSGLGQPLVDMDRLLGGNVEFVAQLAHVGDADTQDAGEADG